MTKLKLLGVGGYVFGDWSMSDEVNGIIKKYKLEDLELVRDRVANFLYLEKNLIKRRLPKNKNVWDNELLTLKYENFPGAKAPTQLSVLYQVWKNDCPSKDLNVSGQHAKIIQGLRELGFQFKKDPRSVKKGGREVWKFRKNGKDYRHCYGFNPDYVVLKKSSYIEIAKKDIIKLKRKNICPITGRGITGNIGLEIDHKVPVEACKKMGHLPAIFKKERLIDEKWKKDFQIIRKKINNQKREACAKCLREEPIWVFPWAEGLLEVNGLIENNSFKTEWNGNCDNCFWSNLDKVPDIVKKLNKR
ncbi:hypothetical protein LCGC14_1356030 [marine sediment metagenome]|uniref:Uncharacterized protein n=1 Tax=marine sediment metagenome TaxID=412755 RepID=A0A0F9KVR8_9ZZZZ